MLEMFKLRLLLFFFFDSVDVILKNTITILQTFTINLIVRRRNEDIEYFLHCGILINPLIIEFHSTFLLLRPK